MQDSRTAYSEIDAYIQISEAVLLVGVTSFENGYLSIEYTMLMFNVEDIVSSARV